MIAAYETKTHILVRLGDKPTTQMVFLKNTLSSCKDPPESFGGIGMPTDCGRWKRMSRNEAEAWVRRASKYAKSQEPVAVDKPAAKVVPRYQRGRG